MILTTIAIVVGATVLWLLIRGNLKLHGELEEAHLKILDKEQIIYALQSQLSSNQKPSATAPNTQKTKKNNQRRRMPPAPPKPPKPATSGTVLMKEGEKPRKSR